MLAPVLLSVLAAAAAEGVDRAKLVVLPAVIDPTARGRLPEQFDELVLTAAHSTGKYEVIGPSDLNAMLDFEKRKDALGCDDTTCFAEIGGALGAQKLMAVQVAYVGNTWLITTKLIDTGKLKVEARSGDFVMGTASGLLQEMPALIGKLFAGGGFGQLINKPYQCAMTQPKECVQQCDLGHAGSCFLLGQMAQYGNQMPSDVPRSGTLYARACDAGEMRGCTALGILYFSGDKGVPMDAPRAVTLFERGCDAGVVEACTNLGLAYTAEQGVAMDKERAAALFERACKMGGSRACGELGSAYRSGAGVPRDPKQAVELFRRGCAMGDPERSCDYLYDTVMGSEPILDRAAGLPLLERTCQEGGHELCWRLGQLYENGQAGIAADVRTAMRYYQLGCRGDAQSSCHRFAELLLRLDAKAGRREMEKRCDAGDELMCLHLGLRLRDGEGMARDARLYVVYFDRACRAGARGACDELGKRRDPEQAGSIGVVMEVHDGWPVVVDTIPDGAGQQAGMIPGDRIISIGGKSPRGLSVVEVVRLVRGRPGTQVTLTIERPDGRKKLVITRKLVE